MPIFTQALFSSPNPRMALAALLLAGFALTGCEKKEIKAYTVPKDIPFDSGTTEPAKPDVGEDPTEAWHPVVKYTLPTGWTESTPDNANIARLKAGDVDIAITALASLAGKESGLVNMYRQLRGQPPLNDEEVAKVLASVPVGNQPGKLFEITDPKDGKVRRLLLAFIHLPEGSLFIKAEGEDAPVLAQKAAFLEFLKSLVITTGPKAPSTAGPHATGAPIVDAPAAPGSPPTPPSAPPSEIAGLPAGWKQVAPGAMQVAKFQVPEVNGAKAEVAVSIFPSDTGGTAANVKRWRVQLGLPEVDDAAAVAAAKPLEGAPAGSLIVHLENGAAAISGAIVPRDGKWWFYKLTGDTPAVNAATEAFTSFAKLQP